MKVKSTKAWHKLPCGHAQWFDKEHDGSPGECASVHGYDRSVKVTFTGEVDEMGWVVPFGELRAVKKFIEYYFDHTTVIPANDPRVDSFKDINNATNPPMFQLRILPYGVSMEMSSRFIWEEINPYIMDITKGRCYVEKVECIEHDSNSAFVEVSEQEARSQAEARALKPYLVMKEEWDWKTPKSSV